METSQNFDDIRPLNDSEVNEALMMLCKQPELMSFLMKIFPQKKEEEIVQFLSSFHTIKDFQTNIIRNIALDIAAKTTKGYSMSGLEKTGNIFNRLYITNHRDIILDSVYLNILLLDNKRETCEIAIGDNLFVKPWVETLVKINKNFVVKRNVPVRQMLEVSSKLSAYIRYTITEKKSAIWIAQREGRAKDSNDRTQESLLKMFNMSGKASLVENMKDLNITPVTISYEYDPCDYLKAKEFQQKRDDANYKKSPQDDALSMITGIQGWKGEIHYTVSNIDSEIDMIANEGSKNEQLTALAKLIDKHIHRNYKIYPSNMIALDLLEEKNNFVTKYTEKEKTDFEKYIQNQLDKIDLKNKDIPFLRHKMLEMYANPLINHLKTIQ